MKYKIFFVISFFLAINTAYAQVGIQTDESFSALLFNPGETKEHEVTIINTSKNPVSCTLNIVDAYNNDTGNITAKKDKDPQNFVGKWGTPEQTTLHLEPLERRSVKITFSIPANATPGDYAGALSLAVIPKEDPTTKATILKTGTTGSIMISRSRIAKIFYLTVSGERTSAITIGDIFMSPIQKENNRLNIPLKNTGNTTIEVIINTQVKPFLGESYDAQPKTIKLLPQEDFTTIINIGSFGFFNHYEISANITYSELDLNANTSKKLGSETKTVTVTIIPWTEIIYLILFLLLIATVLVAKRIHYKNLIKTGITYTAKAGDDLQTIAEKNQISWQLLAKINKLTPPYALKPGKKIIIPKK